MTRPHLTTSGVYFDAGLCDRGPAHPAVERCLHRLSRLRNEWKDNGATFPPVWRGVLLEMANELGCGPAKGDE